MTTYTLRGIDEAKTVSFGRPGPSTFGLGEIELVFGDGVPHALSYTAVDPSAPLSDVTLGGADVLELRLNGDRTFSEADFQIGTVRTASGLTQLLYIRGHETGGAGFVRDTSDYLFSFGGTPLPFSADQSNLIAALFAFQASALGVAASSLPLGPGRPIPVTSIVSFAARTEDDRVTGGAEADTFRMGAGDDTILGGDGNDWLMPGRGDDRADGGSGRDMVSYADLQDAPGRGQAFMVDLDLGRSEARIFGGEVDRLTGFERATGSSFADVMRGTAGSDELRGLGDYDWFIDTAGRDTLDGGSGLDMLSFAGAASTGAAARPDIFTGDGRPPIGFAGVAGVTVNLPDPGAHTGDAWGLTLISIERITGSAFQDVFYGDGAQNDFRGLGGYDWFVASPGGRERYFGGDGLDTVTYVNAPGGVTASLRNGVMIDGEQTGYGSAGIAQRDLYFSIENLVGSRFGDRLEGNDGRNQLRGLEGDDLLLGYGGIDRIMGGAGNDTINGGAGSDFALFSGRANETQLTRLSSTEVIADGPGGRDVLSNVEYFQFDDQTLSIWSLDIA